MSTTQPLLAAYMDSFSSPLLSGQYKSTNLCTAHAALFWSVQDATCTTHDNSADV